MSEAPQRPIPPRIDLMKPLATRTTATADQVPVDVPQKAPTAMFFSFWLFFQRDNLELRFVAVASILGAVLI
jgi:hypothetical protein